MPGAIDAGSGWRTRFRLYVAAFVTVTALIIISAWYSLTGDAPWWLVVILGAVVALFWLNGALSPRWERRDDGAQH